MQLILDLFPIAIFFIAYKLKGLYFAIKVLIGVSTLQMAYLWIRNKKLEKNHLFSFFATLILGGMSILFDNESFIKWKPTIIYWIFAVAIIASQAKNKNIIKKMLETKIKLADHVWKMLSNYWGAFFIVLGALNLFIAKNYSTSTWVNFKLFGAFGLTLLAFVIQSLIIAKYMPDKNDKN